jgi:gentisate 1,2-dioxygenase
VEKQLERRPEPEPVQFSRSIEDLWDRLEKEKNMVGGMPHVIRYSEEPWEQNAMTFVKHYTAPTGFPGRLRRVPLHTLDLLEQIIFPGGKSGKHRHYMEALFYIIEGQGYEIHDEIKYPWEAGDLMCVPTYCVHQHFNPTDQPARFFFCIPHAYELMGLASMEQIEIHTNYQPPEGAQTLRGPSGEVIGYKTPDGKEFRFGAVDLDFQKLMEAKKAGVFEGAPRNNYEYYLRTLTEQTRWRIQVPHVVSGKERPWENTQMGRLKFLSHPNVPSALLMFDAYIQEIPPGGRSGKHRHVAEEVHKILDGRGYDIHDGVRWDWEAEDIVCIPINTTHQHFNADPNRPARFLSLQSRLYNYGGHGGIEHIEDAPDYTP